MKIWRLCGFCVWALIIFVTYLQSQVTSLNNYKGTLIPNASFLGQNYIERIGYALAGAGDVNGDGFDDILIGTFHNAVMGSDAGAAYLILGRSRFPWKFDCSIDSLDARLMGKMAYDAAGYSVACNGDLNGDGFDDMIIGAPAGNDKVPWMTGRVYIVFGKPEANWGFYYRLYDSCDAIYEGENNQDLAGLSVAYIGDVNSDGYDDFICGAPFNDQSANNAGKVYLVLGHPNPWKKSGLLTDVAATFLYNREKAETGYSVAGIGDVNADGTPDFAIGALGASRAFILYGRPRVNWGQNFDLDDADVIVRGRAMFFDDGLGWKIAGGGDINGDGIADVIFSAIHDDLVGTRSGKVFFLFGRKGGWNYQELILADIANASFIGERPLDQAGWGLAFAGDVNSDGFDDVLVGTYKDENGPVDGKAYLIKGKSSGWQYNVSLLTIPDYCDRSPDGIGYAVASAGDFDADGIDDFVISAPFNNDVQKWSGEVYLFASQEIPYQISGRVSYWLSGKAIPASILQTDAPSTAKDTTDNLGKYQLSVRGKHDHTVRVKKAKGQDVGPSITSYDAALIARLAVNLAITDTINSQSADVNFDGQVNMYDAANALRYAVALPPLADSHAGEWVFIPDRIYYDSIIADQRDQNYQGFVRGDIDISWQHPGSVLRRIDEMENQPYSRIVKNSEEFSLPIHFTSDGSLYSFDLDLSYDQQVLEFVRLETTPLTAQFNLAQNDQLSNRLLVGAYSLNALNKTGALLNIIFKVKSSDAGQAEIVINRFQINNDPANAFVVHLTIDSDIPVPDRFQLLQNYPNPFSDRTTIEYHLKQSEQVTITIYNTLGQIIQKLAPVSQNAGRFRIKWNRSDDRGMSVPAGIYFYRIEAGSFVQIKKMVIL